ncbi:MAG: ComEC/Rec2 family competence protein [Clostridia bacterium]
MNRPFAYIGFSCLLGLLVAFVLSNTAIITIMLILTFLFIVFTIKKMDLTPTKLSIFGFVLGLSLCLLANLIYITPYADYIGETLEIKGIIKELSDEAYGKSYYLVEVLEVDGTELDNNFNIEMSSNYPLIFNDFDYISCQVTFKALASEQGSFSRLSAYSNNISLEASMVYYSDIITANDDIPIESYLYKLKNALEEKVNIIFSDDNADVVSAMLLGNKDDLSDEIYSNFRLAGVNHILVVSGMHLTIIMGIFLNVLTKVQIPLKTVYFILIPIILIYIVITGMSKSTLRSGIMFLILIVSNILGEDGDNLNTLGFTVMLICLFNPYSSADIGFLLSVTATSGIILLYEKINNALIKEKTNALLKFIISAFSVTLSAFLFITPLLLYVYGTINPLSLITCTLLAFPTTAILVLTFICISISFIPFLSILTAPVSVIIDIFIEIILFVTEKIAIIGAKIPVLPDIRSVLLFIGIMLIVGISFLYEPTFKLKVIAISAVLTMIFSSYAVTLYQLKNEARLLILDSGEETFSFISKGDEALILSADGYQSYLVTYILDDYGIENIYVLSSETAQSDIMLDLAEDYNITIFNNDVIFEDIKIGTAFENQLITLEYNEKTVIISSVDITSTQLYCDIAINLSETKINADITFSYINDDEYTTSGTYINTESSAICVTFNENFNIRRIY